MAKNETSAKEEKKKKATGAPLSEAELEMIEIQGQTKAGKTKKTIGGKRPEKMTDVVLVRCKRDGYIQAWNSMYQSDKQKWNDHMFDGINPALNKAPLASEVNNFCVVALDTTKPAVGDGVLSHGKPVGIFSMVVSQQRGGKAKPIGKQYVVDPEYQRRGIGVAMMAVLQEDLINAGYDWFYIGCSSMSSRIMKRIGFQPYASDVKGDLYKFNAEINRQSVDQLLDQYVKGKFNVL